MKIAIIGTGNVGSNIGTALLKMKHEVVYGSRDPSRAKFPKGATVKDTATAIKQADLVFLAVPYVAIKELIANTTSQAFNGKTVVDVTNVLDEKYGWAVGFNTSGAEELAKLLPGANVVKAFNTVFAEKMGLAKINGERLTLFVAANSSDAKESVRKIGESIGFDVVDAGDLKSARYMEAIGVFMIHLGFNQKLGKEIGFRLVKGK